MIKITNPRTGISKDIDVSIYSDTEFTKIIKGYIDAGYIIQRSA